MAPGMRSQKSTNVACCDRTRLLIRDPIDIQGTIKFTDDTDYWQANSFPFVFQNVTSFFKLGGEDVFIYGGEFQAGGCPLYPFTPHGSANLFCWEMDFAWYLLKERTRLSSAPTAVATMPGESGLCFLDVRLSYATCHGRGAGVRKATVPLYAATPSREATNFWLVGAGGAVV